MRCSNITRSSLDPLSKEDLVMLLSDFDQFLTNPCYL
jgi:hypothetical protein